MSSIKYPPRKLDPWAALLSYLIPGLGQVMQGRIGKGVLFFVCLYGMFFYGLRLGNMNNVWLPDSDKLPPASMPIVGQLGGVPLAVYHRPQFLGQFWIGIAAWPAIYQFSVYEPPTDPNESAAAAPMLGRYMQAPSEKMLNDQQRISDKRWDLGYILTVIAGVLNLLVIYDALAGPMIRDDDPAYAKKPAHTPPTA